MDALPSDFDASIFVGRILSAVSFSVNTIDLFFEIGLEVQVIFGVVMRNAEGETTQYILDDDGPGIESHLGGALGRTVTAADAVDGVNLVLTFDNGFELEIRGDDEHYECYSVFQGDERIIV